LKTYPIVLAAFLAIIVPSVDRLATPALQTHGGAPISVSVSVIPTRLAPLDVATFAATFSSARPGTGAYTATLELQPRSGGNTPTATQGGFHLHRGQPLSVYWEWRAGTTLPPGVYTVRVRLRDRMRQIVATGTAPVSLIVARHS
jgi:hypothetical protein